MTDRDHHVETALAGLERRLQALQAELDEAGGPPGAPAASRVGAAPEPVSGAAPVSAGALAALDRFGDDLRRTTRELVASWDRTSAQLRGEVADGMVFSGDVALEARTDLEGLAALHRALTAILGVRSVSLRAYAAGHAALDVRLDRGVALVAELRRALPGPFAVEDARPGHLALALG